MGGEYRNKPHPLNTFYSGSKIFNNKGQWINYNLNRFEIHIKHDMEDIIHSKANGEGSDPPRSPPYKRH